MRGEKGEKKCDKKMKRDRMTKNRQNDIKEKKERQKRKRQNDIKTK